MNTKQLLVITALLSSAQTDTFVGPARATAQRLVMAARTKTQVARVGVQTAKRVITQKVTENPKRAAATVAGGVTGYYAAGDSWSQKAAGTAGGVALGFTLGNQGSRLEDVQIRVKDIQGGVKSLEATAARKNDLLATEAALKGHAKSLHDSLVGTTKEGFAKTRQALKNGEDRLSAQMNAGFEENKALHKTVHNKVKSLWSRWGR